MPKLSKIRLTGCKYYGLRREHENSTFDLTKGEKPDHSLFTLKNGEGKGVMMQLISQLLLPGTKWGKKNGNQVISMFYDQRNNLHSFTFHVVLEWVLDTIPEKRLMTGIAVKSIIKNTSTEDEEKTGLSYFLYTHEHDNNGYYQVENLPLYDEKEKEAVDLKSLDEFLNDNKRDFIKYSQTSGRRKDSDYYRYLKSRGINRSEWITLKEINKSEGGISDYFSNASDNKAVFDKVIVPAISENIRNYSSEDGNNLIEMFKSNLSITKDLPILLKRENDYRKLSLSIDPLIENADSGARFMDRRHRLIDEGNDILYILKDQVTLVSDEINKWKDSHEKAVDEKAELKFKKDNLLYNKERNDYLEIENQVKKLRVDHGENKENLEEKKEELNLYHINKILYYKKEIENKIKNTELEKENLIKALDMKDIQEKAEKLDYEVEKEWERTKDKWAQDEIQYHGYIAYTNRFIEEEKNKGNKYREKSQELENQVNRFELERERLKKKRKALEKNYPRL